jgi:hypothetical protein
MDVVRSHKRVKRKKLLKIHLAEKVKNTIIHFNSKNFLDEVRGGGTFNFEIITMKIIIVCGLKAA